MVAQQFITKFLSFITLPLIGFTLFLSGCGEEEEEATPTSAKIVMNFSNVTAQGEYVATITIAGPGIAEPITSNQDLTIQPGGDQTHEVTVRDILSGADRFVTVQILQDGVVLFEGNGIANLLIEGANRVSITVKDAPKLFARFTVTASDAEELENGHVQVDASASEATRGEIKDVGWDWGDGEQTEFTTELTAEHTYTASGKFTITLTVRNDDPVPVTAEQTNTISVARKAELTWDADGATMQLIPAGAFEMGDHFDGVHDANARPVHIVELDDFYIDAMEVTNAMYAKFLDAVGKHVGDDGKIWFNLEAGGSELIELDGGQYRPKAGFADHPVVQVSWYGAAAYAQWSGKRLPTEAEWEKAARGKLKGKPFPWGDELTHDDANYGGMNAGVEGDDEWEQTAPVGSFPANGYGVHDVVGNVSEWCMDEWDEGFYANSPRHNPIAGVPVAFVNDDFANVDTRRVFRGGSYFNNHAHELRVYVRNSTAPTRSIAGLGFRCAFTP